METRRAILPGMDHVFHAFFAAFFGLFLALFGLFFAL
jgi:hypothetical protein